MRDTLIGEDVHAAAYNYSTLKFVLFIETRLLKILRNGAGKSKLGTRLVNNDLHNVSFDDYFN